MENRCPICHKIVNSRPAEHKKESKIFPFCSSRCKLIDLGAWLDGRYRVIGEPESQENQNAPDNSVHGIL